jgi:hypothetical protein
LQRSSELLRTRSADVTGTEPARRRGGCRDRLRDALAFGVSGEHRSGSGIDVRGRDLPVGFEAGDQLR